MTDFGLRISDCGLGARPWTLGRLFMAAVAAGLVVWLVGPAGAAVVPTVSILNPKDGGIVSVSFKVQVQAWDAAATVTAVAISTDGGSTYPYSATKNTNYSPGTGSAIWDYTFTSLATGSYTLKAKATSSVPGYSRNVAITVVAAGTGDGYLLVRDNSSLLCMDCHALSAHSSQFTSTKYGNWETVCRDCHTPHNTENIFLIKETINTPNSGAKAVQFTNTTGDASGSYALSGATTPTNICQVCHTQTRNPSTLAARWRNTGNADTHFTSPSTQRCTNCHQHSLGFRPESPGNIECTQCHSKQWTPMNSSTTTYHMYMQNAAVSTLSPENSRYPQQTTFGSGDTESDHRRCLMCHADMDVFSPSNNPGTQGRAYNLRTSILTAPSASDPTSYANTDYLASGGICLSCHANTQIKNTAKRKDDGTTRTPAWDISQFSGSAHNYAVSSTFSDASTFNANCVKCHNDTLIKDNQTSTYTFGLHDSSYRRMLSPLGLSGATDPLEEQFCYRCHTSDTSVKPANRDYYNATSMTTAAQGIASVFAGGATVADKVGARIVNNTYFTLGLGTGVNSFTAFNSTDSTIQGGVGGQVNFSRTALTAAPIYPGQQRIAVMSLSASLQTAGQTAIWSGASFSRTGTSTDTEIAAIKVYDDSGYVAGTFDANDALVGSGTFTGGTAFVNFSRRQSIVSTTARTYYVVVDLAASITSGHTMTINMDGAALASGFTASTFPLSSNAWTFSTTAGSVTAAFTAVSAANQNQGRPGVLISNFTLTTNTGGALWTALRIDRAGSPSSDADVTRVRVYNDRGATASSFDAGDQELGSGVFSGGTVTISFGFPQILTTTASRFYIIYDIAPGAVVNDQLGASIAAASYFTLSLGTMGATSNTSNAMTVVATTAGAVNVAGATNLAPASVTIGQDRVGIETFTLATASGNALWTALRVDRYSTGTSADDDVATVEIYNDTGATVGTFDASDRVIGTGILSGGSASITLTYPQWLTTAAARYYIVYDYGALKSKHPVASTRGIHKPEERETATAPWNYGVNRHVQCEDCHNPHGTKAGTHAAGSSLAGNVLTGIWGVSITGYTTPTVINQQNNLQDPSTLTYTRIGSVTYESELCLKCHSYYAWTTNTRPNVPSGNADGSTAQVTDQAAEFNPNNLAHHATMGTGKNQPIRVGQASYYNTNWPAFTTGTVTTSGTAVTFSSPLPFYPTISPVSWYLYIGASAPAQGATAWYQIASVTDSTHVTLTTSAGTQTNVAFRLTAGLGNNFVPPYGPWSTLTCSDCHGSNVVADPGGPHGSAGRWILTEADPDLSFSWWNGTSVITVTPNKVAVGGSTSAYATPKIFCFNCHRRDVYGDEKLAGNTATYANLARVSHDPTANTNTFDSDTVNKWGILCMNCHGGGGLGVIHGTNAGKGFQNDGTTAITAANSFRGKRFLYGATWTGVARATTTTAVSCWTKNFTDSVNVCTQGHNSQTGRTANYDYESGAD